MPIGTHALPIWYVVFGDSYKCGFAKTRIPGRFWKLNYCGVFVLVFFVGYTRKLGTSNSMITLCCTTRSMAAAVVISSVKIWSDLLKARLLVNRTPHADRLPPAVEDPHDHLVALQQVITVELLQERQIGRQPVENHRVSVYDAREHDVPIDISWGGACDAARNRCWRTNTAGWE